MISKSNEATNNRPGNKRVIDAPYVFADLYQYKDQLKEEEAWTKNDRNGITLFKTGGVTIVLTSLHAKATMEDNTTDGILILQVVEGKIEVKVEGSKIKIKSGQLLSFHRNMEYCIEAMEDSTLLLTNNR
jgi:quercetin dioxygenase-like cupin family protein